MSAECQITISVAVIWRVGRQQTSATKRFDGIDRYIQAFSDLVHALAIGSHLPDKIFLLVCHAIVTLSEAIIPSPGSLEKRQTEPLKIKMTRDVSTWPNSRVRIIFGFVF